MRNKKNQSKNRGGSVSKIQLSFAGIFASILLSTAQAYASDLPPPEREWGTSILFNSSNENIDKDAFWFHTTWQESGQNPIWIIIPDQYRQDRDVSDFVQRIENALVAAKLPADHITTNYVNMKERWWCPN